jgi:3-(methylthio)propanoyl-CoA dehydrogenase
MANYYDDNADLQYYLGEGLDWQAVYEALEPNPEASPYEDWNEALATWRDVLQLVGDFAAAEVAPRAAAIDKAGVELVNGEVAFPPELDQIMEGIRALDLHGLCIPREVGGMNCPLLLHLVQSELLARADVSVMAHHGFHGGIAMAMMMYSLLEGSAKVDRESKQLLSTRFDEQITSILSGTDWGSMDITEPGAGSDMGALRSVGELGEDGQWRVTGEKIFITSGHGRYHFVIARTRPAPADDPMGGLKGLSLFLVETWTLGDEGERIRQATIERAEEKLGHHGSATVTCRFDQTPAHLVGEEGQGFKLMLLLMNNARISVGFEALGLCEAAVRMARDYAAQRQSMGKTIDRHEIIADYLDEMETDIVGIRALAMRAGFNEELSQRQRLWLQYFHDEGTDEYRRREKAVKELSWKARLVTPLIKFVAAEKAVEISRRALQIMGGYGYSAEYGAEKLLRDALVLPIYEGTSQIQALMATKDSLLRITKSPGDFLKRLGKRRWQSRFAPDELERRVAGVQLRALQAQRHLISKIVGTKLSAPPAEWKRQFSSWDPKTDFAPALLHAEKLTVLLADAAICEELLAQARRHPERSAACARYVERAEPRSRDMLHRIKATGDRILAELAGDGEQEVQP